MSLFFLEQNDWVHQCEASRNLKQIMSDLVEGPTEQAPFLLRKLGKWSNLIQYVSNGWLNHQVVIQWPGETNNQPPTKNQQQHRFFHRSSFPGRSSFLFKKVVISKGCRSGEFEAGHSNCLYLGSKTSFAADAVVVAVAVGVGYCLLVLVVVCWCWLLLLLLLLVVLVLVLVLVLLVSLSL